MPKTIQNQMLTPGATYLVRGQLSFCRITRLTTDREREEANKRRMHPIEKNYTTVSLFNATVLAANPQNPTVEEQYALESLYTSNSAKYPGKSFTAINKSPILPKVGVLTGTNTYEEIIPEHELANGLDVTVVMRVYETKQFGSKRGVSLDRVLVNEPIRYYTGTSGAVDAALTAKYGITFTPLTPTETALEQGAPVDRNEPADIPAENAFVQQTPPPATDTPFTSVNAQPQTNMQFNPGVRQY